MHSGTLWSFIRLWKLLKIFEKCYAGIVECFATDGERKN